MGTADETEHECVVVDVKKVCGLLEMSGLQLRDHLKLEDRINVQLKLRGGDHVEVWWVMWMMRRW